METRTPKVNYYRINPNDQFAMYDVPLLLHLEAQWEEKHDKKCILPQIDCPEYFQPIFSETPKNRIGTAWFGVTVKKRGKQKDGYELQVPAFCEKGRLAVFQRFITYHRQAKNVHQFLYFTRCLPPQSILESIQDFECEDAWYFEMCTGLALVTELTSILVELEAKFFNSQNSRRGSIEKWSDFRLEILADLLKEHRESIIQCPAIYWRSACLRNVFRLVDSVCDMKEHELERQIKLAYTDDTLRGYPITREDWYALAREKFETSFFSEVDNIGISRKDFLVRNFEKATHLRLQENPSSNYKDPEDWEFMRAARLTEQAYFYSSTAVDTITWDVMKRATTAEYTQKKENHGFYFMGCLPKEDTLVQEFTLGARASRRNMTKLEKIRNRNKNEEIFEFIHQTLYGNESTPNLGVTEPAGI